MMTTPRHVGRQRGFGRLSADFRRVKEGQGRAEPGGTRVTRQLNAGE
jgi:hypothetical protein